MDKDNAKSSNKHRQECTPDFKREAVNLVETSSKSVPQIAKDLGISDSLIGYIPDPEAHLPYY
jgi:transposase-like protein